MPVNDSCENTISLQNDLTNPELMYSSNERDNTYEDLLEAFNKQQYKASQSEYKFTVRQNSRSNFLNLKESACQDLFAHNFSRMSGNKETEVYIKATPSKRQKSPEKIKEVQDYVQDSSWDMGVTRCSVPNYVKGRTETSGSLRFEEKIMKKTQRTASVSKYGREMKGRKQTKLSSQKKERIKTQPSCYEFEEKDFERKFTATLDLRKYLQGKETPVSQMKSN